MLDPALCQQSLARVLTAEEDAFAAALEAVFAQGTHEAAAVAAALQASGVMRPSGAAAAWTGEALGEELCLLNAALDQCYAEHGIGA